jgi:hypothetical protein
MARTYRKNGYGYFRHPKTFNQIRNTEAILTDLQEEEYPISGVNRMHKYIPTAWDDLHCSAFKETPRKLWPD